MSTNGQTPVVQETISLRKKDFATRFAAHNAAFEQAMDEFDQTRKDLEDARAEIVSLQKDNARLRADRVELQRAVNEATHARADELQHYRDRDMRLRAMAEQLGHVFADFLTELHDVRDVGAYRAGSIGSSPPGEAQSQSPGGAT